MTRLTRQPAVFRLAASDLRRPTSRIVGGVLGTIALLTLIVQLGACFGDRDHEATQLLTTVTIFGSALVSSVAGFAFSALAAVGLMRLYTEPAQAVQVMVVCSIAIQLYAVLTLWRSIDWARLAPFLAGGAFCIPAGVALLSRISYGSFVVSLGAFLSCYGAFMLWRRPTLVFARSPFVDFLAGALGGITGGLAAFPGAFVTIWCSMQGLEKAQQRAIAQPYILSMQLLTLVTMRAQRIPLHLGIASGEYVLVALFGAYLGIAVFRSISNQQFTFVLNALLMASGVLMVTRSI